MTETERDVRGYFAWLERILELPEYSRLIKELSEILFTYDLSLFPLDRNRVDDGLALRYRYSYEHKLTDDRKEKLKNFGPCTVLEVMVGLAFRIEEEYMSSGDDHPGKWFFKMIRSMGIDDMSDILFDEKKVRSKVQAMLDRDYAPNGEGGLFFIRSCLFDLTKVDLGQQMNYYLNYYIFGGNLL